MKAESVRASREGKRFSTRVLRDVLARLSSREADFALYVHHGPDERFIQFVGTSVRIFANGIGSIQNLESYLLDNELITVETLHEVLEDIRKSSKDTREVLIERGGIKQADLIKLVNQLALDEIKGLVFWDRAQHAIFTGSTPPGFDLDQRIPLIGSFDRQKLCEEVCEWSHSWDNVSGFLVSDTANLTLTSAGEQSASDPFSQHHETCVACRGGVTLRSLMRTLKRDLPEVCEQLAGPVKNGLVEAKRLDTEFDSGNIGPAIEMLESVAETAIGKERVLSDLVDFYLEGDRPNDAAILLTGLAEEASAAGRWEDALEKHQLGLVLCPVDIAVFSKVLALQYEHCASEDLVAFGTGHARVLIDINEAQVARTVAQKVAARSKGLKTEEEILASAFADASRGEVVADQLMTLATEYRAIRDRGKAVETLNLLLALDASNAEAFDLLEKMSLETTEKITEKTASPKRKVKRVTGAPLADRSKQLKKIAITASLLLIIGAGAGGFLLLPDMLRKEAEASAERDFQDEDNGTDGTGSAARLTHDIDEGDGKPTGGSDRWVPFLEDTSKDASAKTAPTNIRPQNRRQVVNRSTVLTYGVSRDLVATDRTTGKELYRVAGTLDAQWSVGRGAGTICGWKAGSRFQLYRPRSRRTGWSDWALPIDTVAVAISPDLIAYRQGGRTMVSELGGTPVAGSDLPDWTEGFFASGELVLVQPDEHGKQLAVFVVDARTVQFLWSFRAEKGHLNFR